MAHFAEFNKNNDIVRTIVVHNNVLKDENGDEQEELGKQFLNTTYGAGHWWIQTSYNGTFRKNFACEGMRYDHVNDLFYNPISPFPSWIYNTTQGVWEAPTARPTAVDEKEYTWDEANTAWKEIE